MSGGGRERIATRRAVWRSRLLSEWWSPGVCRRSIGEVLDCGGLGPVEWLWPRQGMAYRADPFVWPGTDLVLCEEVPLATGIGRLVALRAGDDGRFGRVGALLDDGVHRSYPYVFRQGEASFLLPEAAAGGSCVVYRMSEGGVPEPVATIAPGRRLVDATMFALGDRIWVAATDLAYGSDDNLCLFHAATPEGPWLSHAANPVIRADRRVRSGGTPFEHRGRWYRPAQDCTETYGGALVINEILCLDPDRYAERAVLRLAPDPAGPFPHGLHTIAADGARCWVDGKRYVFSPIAVAGKIGRRLARLTGNGSGRAAVVPGVAA
jgi:hypothetical protein